MKRLYLFVAILFAGLFFPSAGFSQDNDSKVFFLGIGVEKCINGTPGKPNAVADVQTVSKRTQKDAASGDVNFPFDGRSLMINKCVSFTLFNDQATLQNIDSIINKVIRPVAHDNDVLYIYISALSTGANGGFIIPAAPAAASKKNKTGLPVRATLEAAQIGKLCSDAPCRSQLLVADAMAWNENQAALFKDILTPLDQKKKQFVVAPLVESTDSFLVAGKYVSCFAASINDASQPLLKLVIQNPVITNKVTTSLSIAHSKLTGLEEPLAVVFESTNYTGSAYSVPPTAIAKENTIPDSREKESKPTPDKRGTVADAPDVPHITAIRNYALIIANQNYTDPSWPKLNNPINDARALETELKNWYGFEVRLVMDVGIDSMLTEIENLNNMGFDQNSQVLFYYAGHGGVKRNKSGNGSGYIVPVDGKPESEDPNLRTYVRYDIIKSTLDGLKARHVLALVDACFAGSADRDAFAQEIQAQPDRTMINMARSSVAEQINLSMSRNSRYFIGSGNLAPADDGVPGRNSPFAYLLLQQLKDGRDKKKIVSMAGIEERMKNELTPAPYGFCFGSSSACNAFIFVPLNIIPK